MKDYLITDEDRKFMKLACDLASENIDHDEGPFGAVIVKDGEVVGIGSSINVVDAAHPSPVQCA